MIPRYSRPEMVAIWDPQTRFRIWFEIEAHASDAMAELGIIPKEAAIDDLGEGAPRDLRCRAHRRDRARDQARRDRVPDAPCRDRRAGSALRASGHDVARRARHLPQRAAHARRRHPDRRRRQAARGAQAPRLRAQDDPDHRPLARHPCRAGDVRAQARAGLRGVRALQASASSRPARRSRPARSPARSAPSRRSIRASKRMSPPRWASRSSRSRRR